MPYLLHKTRTLKKKNKTNHPYKDSEGGAKFVGVRATGGESYGGLIGWE